MISHLIQMEADSHTDAELGASPSCGYNVSPSAFSSFSIFSPSCLLFFLIFAALFPFFFFFFCCGLVVSADGDGGVT